MICTLSKYDSSDKIQTNDMGGACCTHLGEERCIQSFGGEIGGKETNWKTQEEEWKTILKFNFQEQDGGVHGVNCSGAVH